MNYLIIGGSIAGLSAAKSIRNSDEHARMTMISDERTKPYYRPMIPLIIEKDEVDVYVPDDPIEKYGIQYLIERVMNLDAQSKEVVLSSGENLGFDRLLISTGASSIIPDIPGLTGEHIFPLRTKEDAERIKAAAVAKQNAVVLGGGLVGTKAAIALKSLGLNVTVIEKLSQILYQRLDRRGSEIIRQILKEEGINVITNDSISEVVQRKKKIESVRLTSGIYIDADIVIPAIGTKPNVEVFRETGIEINKGVVVNEYLQTNISDIFAAGDVVEYTELLSGKKAVSALWSNAEEMGRIAGKNMAGETNTYRGFLTTMNAVNFLNVPAVSVGLIEPDGEDYEVVVEDNIDSYRKLVFRSDTLVGAVFIGDVLNAGIYTNFIKNRIPIGRLKQAAIEGRLEYINVLTSVFQRTASV